MWQTIWSFLSPLLSPLWTDWRVTLFAIVVLAALVWNGFNRARWDARWAAAGNGDMDIPEKRFSGYDARDLQVFAEHAERAGMLAFYRSILRGSDLCFAIALAAFTAWLWYRFAVTPCGCTLLNWAALPFGAMAILYGIADVAEDLKLRSILANPTAIDNAEAAATSTLTRFKMVTLSMSLIGGLIFAIYTGAEKGAARLMRRRAAA